MLPRRTLVPSALLTGSIALLLVVAGSRLRAADAHRVGLERAVVENYANLMFAVYSDALAGAKNLGAAVGAFTAEPAADGLARTRQAWSDARVPYAQSEVARFN